MKWNEIMLGQEVGSSDIICLTGSHSNFCMTKYQRCLHRDGQVMELQGRSCSDPA